LELLADRALVEVYRRSEGPGWWYQSYGPADVLRLESLAFALPIGQLYAGITLPEWVEPDELDEDDL
jgi:Uma2 family endonuclease